MDKSPVRLAASLPPPPGRILMTGATGVVGGHYLLWRTVAGGKTVALVRGADVPTARARLRAHLEMCAQSYSLPFDGEAFERLVEVAIGDITQEACGLVRAPDAEPDVEPIRELWHFAASLQFEDRHRETIYQHNVVGTKNTLELGRRLGVARFVYISTAYCVGKTSGPIAEELHDPDRAFNNYYEETKCHAEHSVVAACKAASIEYRILRPSIVVGPSVTHKSGGSESGLYGFIRQIYQLRGALSAMPKAVTIIGDPETPLNLIPVDCVVADCLTLSAKDFPGGPIYHLTAEREIPVGDEMPTLCKQVGVPAMAVVESAPSRSPLERLLDQYTVFYGSYLTGKKRFTRSLDARYGVTHADFEAYLVNYVRELSLRRRGVALKPLTVHAPDRQMLAAFSAGAAEGPAVVLVNAYGMSVDFWIPFAKELAPRFRLFTWESRWLPGLTPDFDPERSGPETFAEDLGAVIDAYGLDSVHLVAWSSGAEVALQYAAKHPHRVRSLTAIAGMFCVPAAVERTQFQTNMRSLMPRVRSNRRNADLYYQLIYGKEPEAARAGEPAPEADREADRETVSSILLSTDPFLLHLTSAPFRNPDALYRYAHMLTRLFDREQFGGAGAEHVPSLLITGDKDAVAHPAASYEIARQLRRARSISIPDGDHFSFYYDARLARQVGEFIVEHDVAPETTTKAEAKHAAPVLARIGEMLVALKGKRANELAPADDFIRRLGLDSIETLELVLSIEETFGIEFGDRPEKLRSLSLLAGHVEALQARAL